MVNGPTTKASIKRVRPAARLRHLTLDYNLWCSGPSWAVRPRCRIRGQHSSGDNAFPCKHHAGDFLRRLRCRCGGAAGDTAFARAGTGYPVCVSQHDVETVKCDRSRDWDKLSINIHGRRRWIPGLHKKQTVALPSDGIPFCHLSILPYFERLDNHIFHTGSAPHNVRFNRVEPGYRTISRSPRLMIRRVVFHDTKTAHMDRSHRTWSSP